MNFAGSSPSPPTGLALRALLAPCYNLLFEHPASTVKRKNRKNLQPAPADVTVSNQARETQETPQPQKPDLPEPLPDPPQLPPVVDAHATEQNGATVFSIHGVLTMLQRSKPIVKIGAILAGAVVLAGIVNATLMYDDLYLVRFFRLSIDKSGLGHTLYTIFFNLDLGPNQYRLYGLSRILHLFLWSVFGSHAWGYAAFISLGQVASAWGIYILLRRFRADRIQSAAVAFVWAFSLFANTTCFHHYSYLILPYQLTIGCALALQKQHDAPSARLWRTVAGVLAVGIAWTGEAHLIASMAVLAIVVVRTPSSRPVRERWIDAAIPLITIPAAVLLHRLAWSALAGTANQPRYIFALPSQHEFYERTIVFLNSLFKGVAEQIQPVVAFAGPWFWVVGLLIGGATVWFTWFHPNRWLRSSWSTPKERDLGVSILAPLVLLLLLSFVIQWALAVFSGQVYLVFPRRYGYIPNTLATMAVVAFLAEPWIRRKAGILPVLAACIVIVWPWIALQAVCLPVIRAQDGRVWAAARSAMAGETDPCFLFVNAWNHPDMPGFQLGAGTPGLRGDFPAVFESPLMGYWWESQYVISVLGARYTGYRSVSEGGAVRLFGNGLLMEESTTVPKDSLIVLTDLGLHRPGPEAGVSRVTTLSHWDQFEASVAAHPVQIEQGWDSLLDFFPEGQSTIDLGQQSDPLSGMFADKHFSDPFHGTGLVANYGLESGQDGIFPAPSKPRTEPLAYLLSNRHGSFTYRVDFSDPSPKWVILDFLEVFQHSSGQRLMKVEAALDSEWFLVGTIDVFAEAQRTPLQVRIPVEGVESFRVRLTKTPGSPDIPFLNGIRVLPITTALPHRAPLDVNFYPPSIAINGPKSGDTVSGTVIVSGWALDNALGIGTPISRVRILVDGVVAGDATYGLKRPDVCAVFPQRPGCPNVGFSYAWNTASLKPGPHQITVAATDTDPTPHTQTTTWSVIVH